MGLTSELAPTSSRFSKCRHWCNDAHIKPFYLRTSPEKMTARYVRVKILRNVRKTLLSRKLARHQQCPSHGISKSKGLYTMPRAINVATLFLATLQGIRSTMSRQQIFLLLVLLHLTTAQVWVKQTQFPTHCTVPGKAKCVPRPYSRRYPNNRPATYFESCAIYLIGSCSTFCYNAIMQYVNSPRPGYRRCYRAPTSRTLSRLYSRCKIQCRYMRLKMRELNNPIGRGLVWMWADKYGNIDVQKLVYRIGRPKSPCNCWYCMWKKAVCPSCCRRVTINENSWWETPK